VSRSTRIVCCAAVFAAVLSPAAHAAGGARLSPSAGAFPLRSFVLTLPTKAATDPSAI
jgi:hypothetical protein